MPRFSRLETLIKIKEIGLIPVFYNPDVDTSIDILVGCADGGATCIEMTNRGDGAIDVFRELEGYCKKNRPDIILGVGSIVDAPTAAAYIAQGANFVVGPVLDEQTAILCNKHKVPYSPGCGSASEIQRAHELGVEFCKIFLGAQVGGPAFVEAVLGPCPWTSIMPTGGVDTTRESLYKWFSSGVACVGIGSKLITQEIIKNKDYKKLTEDVRRTIELIKEIKKEIIK